MLPNEVAEPACRAEYGLPNKSDQELNSKVTSALVKVREFGRKGSFGTGFVVNRQQGLVVTAGHVVKDYQESSDDWPIAGQLADGRAIALRIEQLLCDDCTRSTDLQQLRADFALLRVKPDYLSYLTTQLEAYFPRPEELHKGLYFMGFGASPTGQTVTFPTVAQSAQFAVGRQVQGLYRRDKPVFYGDSGAPVFTARGEVLGIIVATSAAFATIQGIERYIPSVIEAHEAMALPKLEQLYGTIMGHAETGDWLSLNEDVQQAQQSLTNFEIATFVRAFETELLELDGYPVSCILSNLVGQRKVWPYGFSIAMAAYRRANASLDAGQLIRQAQTLANVGEDQAALIAVRVAREAATEEIRQLLNEESGQFALAGSIARNEGTDDLVSFGIDQSNPQEPAIQALGKYNAFLDIALASESKTVQENLVGDRSLASFESYTSERLAIALQHYARTVAQEAEIIANGSAVAPASVVKDTFPRLINRGIAFSRIGRNVARNPSTVRLMMNTEQAISDYRFANRSSIPLARNFNDQMRPMLNMEQLN